MKHKCQKNPPFTGDTPGSGWSHEEYPCQCDCYYCLDFKRQEALPELNEEELTKIEKWAENSTPGPWEAGQLQGFGAMNFLMTLSDEPQPQWMQVVALLENAGGDTGPFIAWCRDGVPRLIRQIRYLEEDKADLKEELDDLKHEYDLLYAEYQKWAKP